MSVLKLLCLFLLYCYISLPDVPTMAAVKNQGNSSFSGFHHFSPGRFGPFYVTTKSVDKCNGTRKVDEDHSFDFKIYVVKVSRLVEEYKGYFNTPMDVQLHEAHVQMSLMRSGSQLVPLYEKFSTSVCQDVFFLAVANLFLKPDKNCIVKKDNYTITGINVNDLTHILTGDYFIHESIQFNMEFFSKKGSIFCYQTIIESKQLRGRKVSPKKSASTPKTTQVQPQI